MASQTLSAFFDKSFFRDFLAEQKFVSAPRPPIFLAQFQNSRKLEGSVQTDHPHHLLELSNVRPNLTLKKRPHIAYIKQGHHHPIPYALT